MFVFELASQHLCALKIAAALAVLIVAVLWEDLRHSIYLIMREILLFLGSDSSISFFALVFVSALLVLVLLHVEGLADSLSASQ